MPVHNAGSFLREAVESIRSQTHTNWELIAIDDGSTDDTHSTLRQLAKHDERIVILTNKKKTGIGYSLNKGLKQANGAYIARMDADDVSHPHRFVQQLRLLNKHPEIIACGGQVEMIDGKGNVFAYKKFPTESDSLYSMIMQMVPLQHPVLLARASVMKKYKYREDLSTAEDVDMLFYLLQHGKLSNVNSFIYQYRKSDMSNGYHNVKKTFFITFGSRVEAIVKYGYKPTFVGLMVSAIQFALVSVLPSKMVVRMFESLRFDPPQWRAFLWNRLSFSFSAILAPITLR